MPVEWGAEDERALELEQRAHEFKSLVSLQVAGLAVETLILLILLSMYVAS